ncbi:MAG TPA: 2-C-methyl-D-erythritol 2,4-cyclodiphosphate synthase [Acidimicrobiales bacterium]|nr:2-C-methyl-D-erythritol 2,4-cyclodiphosphate synthase [Acidimicrobiales bacterium]
MTTRSGIGIDVHPFSTDPGRPLVLGGVHFVGEPGLEGHSDADVVAHAVCDAMLGAAGIGDIGQHFPDTDERWRGADSLVLLAEAAARVRAAGYRFVNADCTVIAERPRIVVARDEMITKLTAAAGGPVHVKATRPEKLGSLGRVEGIACWAVASVEEV